MADQEKIVIEIETLIKTGQIDQARAKLRAFADDVILNNKRIEKSSKEALVNQDRRLRAMSGIQHAKLLAGDAPPGFFKKPPTDTFTKTKFPKGMVEGHEFKGIPPAVARQLRFAKDNRTWRAFTGDVTRFSRWSPEMAEWQAWAKYSSDVGSTRNIEDILGAWHGRTGAGFHRLRGQALGAGMMYSRALGGLRTRAGFVGSDIASVPQQTVEGMERAKANAERAAQVQPFDSIDDLVTSIQKKLDWMGQQARRSKDDLVDKEDALLTPLEGLATIYTRASKAGRVVGQAGRGLGGWLKGRFMGPGITNMSTTVTAGFFRHLAGDKIPVPGMRQPITLTAWMATQMNKERRQAIKNIMSKYGVITRFTEKETDVPGKFGPRPMSMVSATFKAGARDVDEYSTRMAKMREELRMLPGDVEPVVNFHFTNNKMLEQGTLLGSRFAEMGSRSRKMAWGFTWMSMSMLGVYFSLNNLINMGMRGFSMFTQKLMDLEGILTAFGLLQAFGAGAGLDMEKFSLDIEKVIKAWMNLMALFSAGTVMIADLAAEIFGDPEVMRAFGDAIEHVADILKDAEFRESLKTLAINAADIAKNFADIVAWCIPLLTYVTSIKIGGLNLASIFLLMWLAAGFLMPILADLAAVVLILGKTFDLLAWVTLHVLTPLEEAGGLLTIMAEHLLATVTIILIVMEVFGLWKYVVSGLTWAVTELMVSVLKMAQTWDMVFGGGANYGVYEGLINQARIYWQEYNKGLMETQGGLLSIINYSEILRGLQLPTFPAWGGGTTGAGGLTAAQTSWATQAASQSNTINNNYNFGGVNATEDQVAQITYEQTRRALEQLVANSSGYQGV